MLIYQVLEVDLPGAAAYQVAYLTSTSSPTPLMASACTDMAPPFSRIARFAPFRLDRESSTPTTYA